MNPTLLHKVGDLFNFGYYRIEEQHSKLVFIGDIRDEDGKVLEGSESVVQPTE